MTTKSKGTKQDNYTPSTDISQRLPEEEFKMKSMYLSKSAHELKNIFITISNVLRGIELFPNANKEEREQFSLLDSLCNFGLNLILDINTVHVLDYTKTKSLDAQSNESEEFNLVKLLDFCLKIFQARQRFDDPNPKVELISDYNIPNETKIKSINEIFLIQSIIY